MEHAVKRKNNIMLGNSLQRNSNNGHTLKNCLHSDDVKCQECGTSDGLHHFNCLPDHLQFNQFIRTGYRVNLNTRECFQSLFYFHNETFNIYSHGIMAILLILAIPYVYGKKTASGDDPLLYSVHHVTPIICVLCSAIYHLMMCHEKGEKIYEQLIKLDMLGIWLVTTFGSIAFIKGTFFCFPPLYKNVLAVYTALAFLSLKFVLKEKKASRRMRPLVYFGILRILIIYGSRAFMIWLGYKTSTGHAIWFLLGMEFFGFLGGIFNISRFPERWTDGKLDYLCNSHNILHVVVLVCPIFLHFGTVLDFEWMDTAVCSTGV